MTSMANLPAAVSREEWLAARRQGSRRAVHNRWVCKWTGP